MSARVSKRDLDHARAAARATDWSRIASLTEDEIDALALSDPDNPPLTDAELDEMERRTRALDGRREPGVLPAAE
jgi:CRP-like cAMP-binding protein